MKRDDGAALLQTIVATGTAAGWLAPIGGAVEARLVWRAWDIASMIEGSFGEIVDVTQLDEAGEQRWLDRLRGHYNVPPRPEADIPEDDGLDCWLIEGGQRVGTIGLRVWPISGPWVFVQSLYVPPVHRGRGTTTRALRALADAALAAGLQGVRLSTEWTWQKSLRFYLDRNFQVRMWKHDIGLLFDPRWPRWRVAFDGDTAQFVVEGRSDPVFTARRRGDVLLMDSDRTKDDWEAQSLALGTFATELALHGWPLVRSVQRWKERWRWSDAGEPEGLAYKILVFEDAARRRGFVVPARWFAGAERWDGWNDGEAYGRDDQMLLDLDVVLRERGFTLDDERRALLAQRMDDGALQEALRRAVTATSLEEWWAETEPKR